MGPWPSNQTGAFRWPDIGFASAIPTASCATLFALVLLAYSPASHAARTCDDWHAEFLSVEGSVEIQRAERPDWIAAARGDRLCTGDSVRVHRYSRATVRLPDQSMLRLDEHTTLAFSEPEDETGSWLELLRGAIHVISRDPRSLRFFTPYANAGLEGTEFLIRVADAQMNVAVLEGEVVVTNPNGMIGVTSGHLASASADQAPVSIPIAEPLDYSRWASHYPVIIDGDLPAADQVPTAALAGDADFYVGRAARRLSYGRVDAAQSDLAAALSLTPASASARAVQAVAALGANDHGAARELAEEAVTLAPESAAPLLALSYVRQADADPTGMLSSLRRAIELEPTNAIAWARLSEAELARGNFDRSLAAATQGASLQPALGHAQAMLGFANLSRLDTRLALEAFARAIDLDQGAPLPRLGLALVLIQQDQLAAGREQLEIAVALDPANALARSYMAKTYAAENRSELTQTQLDLAKRFDPTDPTPWLYSSLHERDSNRPVEALRELQTAIGLNDDRPVYRSSLSIEEDLGSRSAGLGRLHRELGFEELALLQGRQSLLDDPTDYSGYRLLADVYSKLPRHEIARVSSLFQSQMLQPLNLVPVQPQLAEANLFILDEAGPSELAFGEFSPLLNHNGLRLHGSVVSGANNTVGEDVALAGVNERFSFGAGYFQFATDGFRENNDLDQTVANAFIQLRPSYGTSVQAELRSTETESGSLLMLFDPTRFDPNIRQVERVDAVRLGARRDISERGTILAAVIHQDAHAAADVGTPFAFRIAGNGYSADVQHIYRADRWSVNSGVSHMRQDRLDVLEQIIPVPDPPFAEQSVDTQDYEQHQTTGYVYANFAVSGTLTLAIGASADYLESLQLDKEVLNPKIGLTWEPTADTTVRAAAFTTLQGGLTTSRQNIQPRLEPIHVAGFNQFFYGTYGEESTFKGMSIDHRFSENLFSGFETSRRELRVPLLVALSPQTTLESVDVDEDVQRAYVYWTPTTEVTLSAEFRRERFDNGEQIFLDFSDLRTHRLPIEARYFHPSGFSARLRASHVRQDGHFASPVPLPGSAPEFLEDQFWVFDASFGYRLPNRRGVLSLNIDNMLDESFRFQDADPFNPSIAPERMAYFRFTLAFE